MCRGLSTRPAKCATLHPPSIFPFLSFCLPVSPPATLCSCLYPSTYPRPGSWSLHSEHILLVGLIFLPLWCKNCLHKESQDEGAMGRERIRQREWKKERDKDREKGEVKRWQRCEGSSLGSQMYNLILCACVCQRERENNCVWFCTWLVVHQCLCVCVWGGGTPVGSYPVLPPRAVFAEACRRCCGLAEVNKGVQASLLIPIGSQAEALALPIKPITHSQLTPDSLSAYLAWRLSANRQRQRRWGGLCYWKRAWKEMERGRGRVGEWVRLFSMVSAEEPKVRASGGRERP